MIPKNSAKAHFVPEKKTARRYNEKTFTKSPQNFPGFLIFNKLTGHSAKTWKKIGKIDKYFFPSQ